jgi:hypothetical protein
MFRIWEGTFFRFSENLKNPGHVSRATNWFFRGAWPEARGPSIFRGSCPVAQSFCRFCCASGAQQTQESYFSMVSLTNLVAEAEDTG